MKLGSVRAVVASVDQADPVELTWAVACMRTGVLLGDAGQAQTERLESLAATLPEVFRTADSDWLTRMAALDTDSGSVPFGEVLFLSEHYVHVIQPLSKHHGVAFLAVSPAASSVGLVLSRVRAQVAALENDE